MPWLEPSSVFSAEPLSPVPALVPVEPVERVMVCDRAAVVAARAAAATIPVPTTVTMVSPAVMAETRRKPRSRASTALLIGDGRAAITTPSTVDGVGDQFERCAPRLGMS